MRSLSFSSSSKQTAVSARGGGTAGDGGGPGGSGKKAAAEAACCSKVELKRGPWTAEEDEMLAGYVRREGEGRWRTLPKKAGLLRCGKSCRLRWMNYLRPSIKRGHITADEEDLILRLHRLLGNRWSLIAGRIPGRTDNEIKNYWNTRLSKKLMSQGIDPKTHKQAAINRPPPNPSTDNIINNKQNNNNNNNNLLPLFDHVIINDITTVQHGDDHHNGIMATNGYHDHDDMINNYCPDNAFSSFLNSLINDDMFNNNHHDHQVQQQHDDDDDDDHDQHSSCVI